MNQIIVPIDNSNKYDMKNNKKISIYKYLIYFSTSIIIFCIIIYAFIRYNSYKKEKISKTLMNNFSITRLYSDINNTTINLLNNSTTNNEPFVIGLIEIEKIDIMNPILSETSEELLKIAPCRFYGPFPNEVRKSLYCRSQLRKQ